MPELIVMAAGFGRRFGGGKLTAELGGKPLYSHIVDELFTLDYPVTVVTRPGELERELSALPLRVVINENADQGKSASIRAALSALGHRREGYMFFTADQPWLKAATVEGIIAAWRVCGRGIVRPVCRGAPGSPVVFAGRYYEELMTLRGDEGGKAVIKNHQNDVYDFVLDDESQLRDIDTKEDMG